ncbi:MAG: O-antigen ligase family protein [Dermatophilaceae bacterium]
MSAVASAYEYLRTSPKADSSRIPDFMLGMAMPLTVSLPGVPANLSILALLGAIGLAVLRKPDPGDKMPWWAPAIAAGMIGWMTLSLLYNGLNTYLQLAYFVGWVLSILAFASGRLDRLSLCRGISVGLVIGALAGLASRFAGIGGDQYPGRLTGYVWGDPNQAGYYLTVLTCLALIGLRPGWRRWLALALFTVCIVLTLSRTSMVAMCVASLWFAVRRRATPGIGVALVAAAAYVLNDLSDRLKNWGPFAQRAGSDMLRERIDAISAQLVTINPIIGRGPGTAFVEVQDQTFFFHNAYLAVRNNGGWILLILLLTLIALVAIRMLSRPSAEHHPWHEAALIAVLICSLSLGEALLRAPSALAIGLALRHAINPFELRNSDKDDSPDHVL